ncbi:hypothetical protein SAMN04488020_102465 [Palleronia marisminoris]|uniref:Uncharacterized protein n=1 Tax=Palleronia marisminoris TaxID=315423 RepID=A0A1Y5RS44_9RHOB|nr:hypothetical protein [Palleronia marisminoris]SFG53166.1 hypothetical protein SAMN04488020_102465 [Palleronia marisminoris]SLN23771.1 hypothetical protein PAM7066_00816 [Palleronia marisminoris]
MARLLLAALVIAIVVTLVSMAVRQLTDTASTARARLRDLPLGESPMQRLSFVLLVALIFYAAIWGAG